MTGPEILKTVGFYPELVPITDEDTTLGFWVEFLALLIRNMGKSQAPKDAEMMHSGATSGPHLIGYSLELVWAKNKVLEVAGR